MDVTILYGSQTGNAEDLAKRICYMSKSHGLKVEALAADDFDLKQLPKINMLIFVCSTTGHGQEPENMKNFYNFMRRRNLPRDCLSGLKFVVYGLGDSSYSKFNYVSKIIYKRLEGCGAKPVQKLVLGDEQHELGCDGIIYPKLDEFWKRIDLGTQPISIELDRENLPRNSYKVNLYHTQRLALPVIFSLDYMKRYDIHEAVCTINQRITSEDHFQDTRFLSFRTKADIQYEPGDVCCILPANSDDNVDKFIELLNLDSNQQFRLVKEDPNYMVNYLYDFVPDGLTIRHLVKYYLDIQSVPRRSFFQFLWPFSQSDLERDKLREFASLEGQEEMYDYCVQPKRSILEVLMDFPHSVTNIKFECLFDLIPPIKPRSFSIASAQSLHPKEVQLIVGVVRYETRMKKIRLGLCSNYLARLNQGDKLLFYIKRSSFKLPTDHSAPIIMIGPGLGIAPFRSFIEEMSTKGLTRESFLYFGCRYRNKDFYFKDELERYSNDMFIRLRVAFSREEPRQLIQDLLSGDSELIRRLIKDDNAIIYVAGNSKLPEEVRTLLGKILNDGGDLNQSSDEKVVSLLEAQGRIQYDCW